MAEMLNAFVSFRQSAEPRQALHDASCFRIAFGEVSEFGADKRSRRDRISQTLELCTGAPWDVHSQSKVAMSIIAMLQ